MDRLNVRTITQTISGVTRFEIGGAYMRLIEAADLVTLEFFRGGVSIGTADNFMPGLAIEGLQFDAFTVTPSSAGKIVIVVGDAPVKYDRAAGTVTISGTPSVTISGTHDVAVASLVPCQFTGSNVQKTVTSASAQLVAAKANRKYLLIQNNDAAGIIYVTFGGVAATTANGVKIPPGGSYELNCNVPTSEVRAIGSIASNASVVVVEG